MRLGDPRADLDNIQNFALTGIRSSDCTIPAAGKERIHNYKKHLRGLQRVE